MTPEAAALWGRLEEFEVDARGATAVFRQVGGGERLVVAACERIVAEYKRFLFLAATSAEPVCPSGRRGPGVASASVLHAIVLGRVVRADARETIAP